MNEENRGNIKKQINGDKNIRRMKGRGKGSKAMGKFGEQREKARAETRKEFRKIEWKQTQRNKGRNR